MSRSLLVVIQLAVLFGTTIPLDATGHHDEPSVNYALESGWLAVGAQGVAGLDGLDRDQFTFQAVGSHPDLRLRLEFAPTEAGVDLGPAEASVLFAVRVDLSNATSGAPEASFVYPAPGSRSHLTMMDVNATESFTVDVVLLWGADVTWILKVDGFREPEPLDAMSSFMDAAP